MPTWGIFGRQPIKLAWLYFVLPALILNYMGQAALLITNPAAANSPFFNMVDKSLLWPLVGWRRWRRSIASQAVISGHFR